jgi:hypothetical protein
MADSSTVVPFVDGTSITRQQLSTNDNAGSIAPQTALRTNGGPVEVGNPLPVHSPAIPLVSSATLEASHIFRTAPASLYTMQVAGLSAFGWLLVFDAVSPPDDGAVAPVAAIPATALAGTQITFGGTPALFVNGVVGVLSTTGPFVKTTGPTGFFSALVL